MRFYLKSIKSIKNKLDENRLSHVDDFGGEEDNLLEAMEEKLRVRKFGAEEEKKS